MFDKYSSLALNAITCSWL